MAIKSGPKVRRLTIFLDAALCERLGREALDRDPTRPSKSEVVAAVLGDYFTETDRPPVPIPRVRRRAASTSRTSA